MFRRTVPREANDCYKNKGTPRLTMIQKHWVKWVSTAGRARAFSTHPDSPLGAWPPFAGRLS